MKTILIKLSGKVIDSFINDKMWMNSMKSLKKHGINVVIVHGSGEQVTEWSSRLGVETTFYNGQRVSNKETMDIVLAVQSGMINSKINAKLNSEGICSVGLSGQSFGSFIVTKFEESLGYVGYPDKTNNYQKIESLISENIIPVFSTVCMSTSGEAVNVNADVFTVCLAEALNIKDVYMISDISAVRIDGIDTSELFAEELSNYLYEGQFTDGMIPKIESTLFAFEKGVERIWIGSSKPENILESIIFNGPYGTKVSKEVVYAE